MRMLFPDQDAGHVRSVIAQAVPFTQFDAALQVEEAPNASIILQKRYWRVLKAFKFYVGDNPTADCVYVPAGYLTDGASVPKIFRWLLPPWGSYGQAAVVHDMLCGTLTVYRDGVPVTITRAHADSIFKTAMKAADVPVWKRNVMYIMVRVFSKLYRSNEPVYDAMKGKLEADWQQLHPSAVAT